MPNNILDENFILKNISILIQGVIDDSFFAECLNSVKTFIPSAEIVVSTWTNEQKKLDKYENLKIVFLKDPGYVDLNDLGNINRQIFGRKKGLEHCTKKYTLIIRTDSKIINLNFIKAFIKFGNNNSGFFENRIVSCSVNRHYNFFLNDWYYMGLTNDIKELYNIELFKKNKYEKDSLMYLNPHLYLGMSLGEKILGSFNKLCQKELKNFWLNILVENFVMIGFYSNYGISNLKSPYRENEFIHSKFNYLSIHHLYHNFEYEDWIKLYNKKYKKHEHVKIRIEWFLSKILFSMKILNIIRLKLISKNSYII